jgi:hypothetical protein
MRIAPMQKFFARIGMAVVICLAVGMGRVAWDALWAGAPMRISEAEAAVAETQQVSAREALMRSINWVRATLPRKINDQTKLVAVGIAGSTYWSHLVLDVTAGQMSSDAKAEVARDARVDACARLSSVMQGGVISTYRADYVDRGRQPIQTVEISKSDCP